MTTAYVFSADLFCEECIVPEMCGATMLDSRGLGDADSALDMLARMCGIDRTNEATYDSDQFPKVVFTDQLEDGDRCGRCAEEL